MKKNSLIFLFITFFSLQAQNNPIPELVEQARQKASDVRFGYIEVLNQMKYMTKTDTITQHLKIYFKKTDDSIFGYYFHQYSYQNDTLIEEKLYNGQKLIIRYKNDTATYYSVTKDSALLMYLKISHRIRLPYVDTEQYPFPPQDTTGKYRYFRLRPARMNGKKFKRFLITGKPGKKDLKNGLISDSLFLWINPETRFLRKYKRSYGIYLGSDTMYQVTIKQIIKYDFDKIPSDSVFSPESFPPQTVFKHYKPRKRPELLPGGQTAPPWKALSLNGDTLSLKDFRGQLVILDFFYSSCYPCLLAMPEMQDLYDKYKDRNVVIIGVNPFDRPEKLKPFLAKKKIRYPVIVNAKIVADTYKVSGYPTIYVISPEGKIVKTFIGFRDDLKNELEKIINEFSAQKK